MKSRSKALSPGAAAVWARGLALALIATQAGLHLASIANVPVLFLSCVAAVPIGLFVARSHLRALPAAAIAIALPFAARAVFRIAVSAAAGGEIAPAIDRLIPAFESCFVPFWPAFSWAVLAAFLHATSGKFARMEPLVNAGLLVAALSSQAGFRLTLYPHPLMLGAAVAAILALEALSMHLAERASRGNAAPRSAGLLLALLPLALILLAPLFVAYAEASVKGGGGLIKPTLFRFDFSDVLSLETEISLGRDLVMLVRKDSESPSYLMRRYVLSRYERGKGFVRAEVEGTEAPEETRPRSRKAWPGGEGESRVRLDQEYYVVNFDQRAFVAMNRPVEAVPLEVPEDSGFQSAYRVTSLVPSADATIRLEESDLFGEGGEVLPEEARRTLTDFGGDEKVAELAAGLTEGIEGPYGKALALNDYLRSNYRYSLRPGVAPDGDQLSHFLFVTRKGYCSYFAFSMTLMLRSLGIPSRVAAGFFLRPEESVLGVHPVRTDMAHAWVEAWFPETGWIEFDPTSDQLADGEEPPGGDIEDPERLKKLIQELFARRSAFKEAGTGAETQEQGSAAHDSRDAALAAALRLIPLALPPLLLAACLLPWASLALRAALARAPRAKALARYKLIEFSLSRLGFARNAGESRAEWALRTGLAGPPALAEALAEAEAVRGMALWAPEFPDSGPDRMKAASGRAISAARSRAGIPRAILSIFPRPLTSRRKR